MPSTPGQFDPLYGRQVWEYAGGLEQSYSHFVEQRGAHAEVIEKALSYASFFDLETSGIVPGSSVYEVGATHYAQFGIEPEVKGRTARNLTAGYLIPQTPEEFDEWTEFSREQLRKREEFTPGITKRVSPGASPMATGGVPGDIGRGARFGEAILQQLTPDPRGVHADSPYGAQQYSAGGDFRAPRFTEGAPYRDLFVQNLKFEASILGDKMAGSEGRQAFKNWAERVNLQSIGVEESGRLKGRLLETDVNILKLQEAAKKRGEGLLGKAPYRRDNVADLKESARKQGEVFTKGYYEAIFGEGKKLAGTTTRVFDTMNIARSVFALAQQHEHMALTGDFMTGTSVEAFSQAAYGFSEFHGAPHDTRMQAHMTETFLDIGRRYTEKQSLTEAQTGLLKHISDRQEAMKVESTRKRLYAGYFGLEEKRLGLKEGALEGKLEYRKKAIAWDVRHMEEGELTPSVLRVTAKGKAGKHMGSMDEIVKELEEEAALVGDTRVNYRKEYEAMQAGVFSTYEKSKALAQGETQAEAALRAAGEIQETRKATISAPVDQFKTTLGDGLRAEVKTGLGVAGLVLGGIFAYNLFSGRDDEYNTVEGFSHKGISGSTRRYNTDFGSGYQGLPAPFDHRVADVFNSVWQSATSRGARPLSHANYNYISSRDDEYNTNEGLSHRGMAGARRRRFTEFGSGYQGPNPWLHPAYNEAEDQPKFILGRSSSMGASYQEHFKKFTEPREDNEVLSAYASAGSALHRIEAARKLDRGEIERAEEFIYDPWHQISGHIDLTLHGGVPADVKTVTERGLERIRRRGAREKHLSQLNFYMYMKGSEKGYLEYVSREDQDEREVVWTAFDPELLHQDIKRMAAARKTVRRSVRIGLRDEADLPRGAGIETYKEAATAEAGEARRDTRFWNSWKLQRAFKEEMEYIEVAKQRRRLKQTPSNENEFSGKDDHYNTLEAFKHQGIMAETRRIYGFGSGTDSGAAMRGPAAASLMKAKPGRKQRVIGGEMARTTGADQVRRKGNLQERQGKANRAIASIMHGNYNLTLNSYGTRMAS